jgi:TPP-dependent pyruvate/acetoin dehydrogenase alpha subunit
MCNGNNVLDVFAATKLAVNLCRQGKGPVLLIAETFRMGGHATHDEREARQIFSPQLFEYWGKRDPIGMYEAYLESAGFTRNELTEIEERVIAELKQAEGEALASRETHMPRPEAAVENVYA